MKGSWFIQDPDVIHLFVFEMINYIIIYFSIGALIMFISEMIATYIVPETNVTFNNKERIAGIVLWPILVAGVFISNLFK